jgi:lipoyl(octanoyl) transferase
VLTLVELGRVEYARALRLQERLVELRRAGAIGDVLLLLEHEPVLTLGRNAGRGFVLASDAELAARGIALHVVKRGGDVTYHGPGQLVGYPVFSLREHAMEGGARMGVVDFVRRMEEVLIRVAGEYGVRAQRVAGRTGVWTEPTALVGGGTVAERKLAAIGVHVSRGVTSHGLALNVSTDLRDFGLIVPCGIADRGVSSLEAETGEALTVAGVGQAVARNFGRVFGRQVLAVEAIEDVHAELAGW